MITKGRNHISRKLSFYLMAGTIVSLYGMTAPAHAGFNWNPPPPPPKASPAPDAVTAPLAPVEADAAPVAAPAPVAAVPAAAPAPAPAEKTSWAPQAPLAVSEAPKQETVKQEAPAVAPAPATVSYKEIRGFGKDIPLAMAINQIVPSDFTYSFASDVNTGTAISWQGDRPWNVVLKESLEPAGLVAVVDGNAVKIEKWTDGSAGSWSSPAPMAAPAAPHYTDEQLAAIGSADNGNYQPKYPRHKPSKMHMNGEEPQKTSGGVSWQSSSGDAEAAKAASPASAEGQPTQLADKMQHQKASEPAQSSGMKWQPGSAPTPPSEEKTASAAPVKAAASTPAPVTSLAPVEAKTAGGAVSRTASMNSVSSWQASKGQSLHDTLSAWCSQSGVNLIWEAKKDYKLPSTVDTKGTFTDAVTKLLTQYNGAKPRPVGQLHPNLPDGPPVLVIANEAGA